MKKILYILLIFPILILIFIPSTQTKHALSFAAAEDVLTEQDINSEISDRLNDLDFSDLDKILADFTQNQKSIFGANSFVEKLKHLLNGNFNDAGTLFQQIISIFFEGFSSLLPSLSIIVAVSLLGNMIQGIKPSASGKSLSNIIHFITYGIVVTLVLSIVTKMIYLTGATLTSIQGQMNAIFPILLTLLTAIGGTKSVSIYQPAMALLTNGILNLFTHLLLPIFIFSVVFSIISNMSNSVKLDKFSSFCNSSFKWLVGLIFTIFTAFLSLQGFTAGSIDGISIRTAKYAIRSYVPILGGYLSDGMGLILISSNLIKNVVGASGLFMVFASIISPLIEMILFMLALKLISGIIEPLGNKQVANFISSLSKNMVLLIVILIGVIFVYFILIGLVICSANIV